MQKYQVQCVIQHLFKIRQLFYVLCKQETNKKTITCHYFISYGIQIKPIIVSDLIGFSPFQSLFSIKSSLNNLKQTVQVLNQLRLSEETIQSDNPKRCMMLRLVCGNVMCNQVFDLWFPIKNNYIISFVDSQVSLIIFWFKRSFRERTIY
ncbi:Hypothetical_protein [Hexamita inflata]|uniref:Hypothetical_protein n=1 Tax=Hexamita inflata TaxID=28002 RepID=A0ABP1GG17_9EUKA